MSAWCSLARVVGASGLDEIGPASPINLLNLLNCACDECCRVRLRREGAAAMSFNYTAHCPLPVAYCLLCCTLTRHESSDRSESGQFSVFAFASASALPIPREILQEGERWRCEVCGVHYAWRSVARPGSPPARQSRMLQEWQTCPISWIVRGP